jgi:vitamin B12 transporter
VNASRSLVSPLVLVATSAWSAQPPGTDPVDQIVVTATRTSAALSSVGDSMSVIEAEAARQSQKVAVSDLLLTTPGITATRNGGLGTSTSVRIRGAESDQTVVLIDGVKLNDPSSAGGGYNFANLLVSDIARIEVLRGSQSTLWGSQAIGGVVNVVTPEPTGPLSTTVDAQAGSYGTARLVGSAQSGNERYGWRVGANYLTTDGVSAFDEDLGGREDDGFRSVGASVRGLLHLSDAVTAEIRSAWQRARSGFDGFPPPTFVFADTREYTTTKEWVSYAGVKIDSLAGRLQHRLGAAYTDTDRENIDPASTVPQTFDAYGRNLRWEYQGTLALNDVLSSVFGAERERSEFSSASPTPFNPNPVPLQHDVTLDSVYAQLQVSPVQPLTLTGGVRYDDHENFGDHTSAQAGVAWSITDATLVRASYGEGFKAPTLYQLFSQYGTTGLAPEQSEDWDVGFEQRLFDRRVAISATYFERDTDHMIDFVSCFGVNTARCRAQPDGYYENVQQTTADGYEVGLQAQLATQLLFSASYTELDARNASRGTSNFGRKLPRRANESAAAQLSYQWRIPLTTTLAAQYVGRTFDDAANRFVLDEYVLVDLRAAYEVSDSLEIYARVENLFDEDYQTARRYGSLGRGAYVGVRLTL